MTLAEEFRSRNFSEYPPRAGGGGYVDQPHSIDSLANGAACLGIYGQWSVLPLVSSL